MDYKLTLSLAALVGLSLTACESAGDYVRSRLFNPNTDDVRPGMRVVKRSQPEPTLDTVIKPATEEVPDENPTLRAKSNPAPKEYPTGKIAKDKPGFVEAPYGGDGLVDIRGMAPGSLAKDPYTGKPFWIPVEVEND